MQRTRVRRCPWWVSLRSTRPAGPGQPPCQCRYFISKMLRQSRGREGGNRMSGNQVLGDLASALMSGTVDVVDLTAPLGPETPLIKLPPQIGKNTPAIEIHAISSYDQDGPFWAWNWLK